MSTTTLPPFDAAVLRAVGDAVHLIGSRCDACGALSFPARVSCSVCGGAATVTDLPGEGEVYAVTTSAWPIAGLTPPTTVVQVNLAHGLRVQGVATAPLSIGERARVVPIAVTGPDGDQLGFGFAGPDA
jgi:uncharacterized OB-fold protein